MPHLCFLVPFQCMQGKGPCLQPVSRDSSNFKDGCYSFTCQGDAGVGRHEAIHSPSGTFCHFMLTTQVAWFGGGFCDHEVKETVTGTCSY